LDGKNLQLNHLIVKNFFPLPIFTFRFSFLGKSKLVARKQGHCAEKASTDSISDFELRISDLGVFSFNPHSAIGIPHFGGPPGPENELCLMVFACNALVFGPRKA